MPVTERTKPTVAISTGIPTRLRNTGSLATSSIHGRRAGHATTSLSGKTARKWSGDTPAIGRPKATAAGSTEQLTSISGSLATSSIQQTVCRNATTRGHTIGATKNGIDNPAVGSLSVKMTALSLRIGCYMDH